jgi:hypothetical protein
VNSRRDKRNIRLKNILDISEGKREHNLKSKIQNPKFKNR